MVSKKSGKIIFRSGKSRWNIQRFSFLFVYYISQNIWLRQKINEKINKEKPFAILEFACKMLQKLSSKMLKRCPLLYTVVLKSCMSRHLKYMANSPQSAVSECSVISVAVSSHNNKKVEVTRLRWYYTSAVQVWFLNCSFKYYKEDFSSFRPVKNEGPDSFLHEQTAQGEPRGCRIVANQERSAYTIPWPIRGIGFPWEKWQSILRANMNEETLIYYRMSQTSIRTWTHTQSGHLQRKLWTCSQQIPRS